MQYKIEKNIPVSPLKRAGRALKYPFIKMEIGDSFRFETKDLSKVSSSAANTTHRYNYKFIICKQNVGHRVWRIA